MTCKSKLCLAITARGQRSVSYFSNTRAMLFVCLLTIGISALAIAQDLSVHPVPGPIPIEPVPVRESVVLSQHLDPEYTPCR